MKLTHFIEKSDIIIYIIHIIKNHDHVYIYNYYYRYNSLWPSSMRILDVIIYVWFLNNCNILHTWIIKIIISWKKHTFYIYILYR